MPCCSCRRSRRAIACCRTSTSARGSAGASPTSKSSIHVWSAPGNVVEDVGGDGLLEVNGKDNFVPSYGARLHVSGRRRRSRSAASTTPRSRSSAKGTAKTSSARARARRGSRSWSCRFPTSSRCARRAARSARSRRASARELPRSATLGGRYKFLGANGEERGDIELERRLGELGQQRRLGLPRDDRLGDRDRGRRRLRDQAERRAPRLPGRLQRAARRQLAVPVGEQHADRARRRRLRHRGREEGLAARRYRRRRAHDDHRRRGLSHGAASRSTPASASCSRARTNNPGDCNPISPRPNELGCNRDGVQAPLDDRRGPDPINPLLVPDQQLQAPVNQGVFKSHYVMFMLGATTWF